MNPTQPDPITRYFEQVEREEQIARTLADDAARHPPVAANSVQVPGDRFSFDRPVVRGFVGMLLAACIGGAAFWQSYGDAAKKIAKGAPQLVQTSSAQPTPPAVQADAGMAAPSQPAPLAPTGPEGVAPAAALSPESAQLLQTMTRDLATMRQENEQLKASIEQLKTNQEQMTRDIAKASEGSLRPKVSAPPPRPTAGKHNDDTVCQRGGQSSRCSGANARMPAPKPNH